MILLIEDNPAHAELVMRSFEEPGITTRGRKGCLGLNNMERTTND